MDKSKENAHSEMNEENSDYMFPFEDDNMLNKLRSCSIIPKELSEFQIFVRTLTGNTISDDIIQEAWKHIYLNKSSNSSVGGTLTSSGNGKYQTPTSRNNTSKISWNSGEVRKKVFSSQKNGISHQKEGSERKKKNTGDSSRNVKVCKDMASEKNKHYDPLTVHHNVPNLVADPQPSDSILKRVKKGQCSFSSASETIKQTKVSYSANEINDYLDEESDLVFVNTPSKSNNLVRNHILDNDCEDTPTLFHKVKPTLREKLRKNGNPPVAFPNVDFFPNRDNYVEANGDSRKNEDSSSDCEVIEIVSLNKSINNTDDSESELDKSVSENEKSDSDNSIEILETRCNIKQSVNEIKKTDCPVHKRNDLMIYPNSHCFFRTPNFNDSDSQTPKYPERSSCLCCKEKKTKVEKKKKKDIKYKLLQNEVKTLKSLLVDLLTSLQNVSTKSNCTSSESMPCLLKKDLLNRLDETFNQGKVSNGSFLEEKKKSESKVKTSEKVRTPLVVEGNAPIKGDKSNQWKQKNIKNMEDSNDCHEPVGNVNLESSTSGEGRKEKFMWREIIKDTLKSRPERQMPVEKLKRMVIAKYYFCKGYVSKNTTVKFFRYLHSTSGVIVDKDMAIYSSKHNIKLSSLSEQRKRFVLKTVTTTKEYKIP